MPAPRAGEVLTLQRTLELLPDPLALFSRLTGGGKAADTLLLESADLATRRAERSFLLTRSALRIEGRGREVRVTALTGATGLLDFLSEKLADTAERDREGRVLSLRFPPAAKGSEKERLAAPSPTDALRALVSGLQVRDDPSPAPPLLAGYFSYDFLGCYESLPEPVSDPLGAPDFCFWLPEEILALNHRRGRARIVCRALGGDDDGAARYHDAVRRVEELGRILDEVGRTAPAPPFDQTASEPMLPLGPDPAAVTVDLSDEEYAALVEQLKGRIVSGDVFQIVPSRTFSLPAGDPLETYRSLRALNPSPYMFYLQTGDFTLFGASPETALKVEAGAPKRVTIAPIAGTAARGRTPDGSVDLDLDGRLEAELRLSEKELAEHMMLIDLARNDVARVSRPGTRHVARLLAVDRYSHVMHLVSQVEGELAEPLDALHAYVASMNMGTLVGAPKLKAAEILRRCEATRRGPYGGAVGYLSADGGMDSGIIIRSAVIQGGTAWVRAGAGIVHDSNPAAEAEETRRKAGAVLRAVAEAGRR